MIDLAYKNEKYVSHFSIILRRFRAKEPTAAPDLLHNITEVK